MPRRNANTRTERYDRNPDQYPLAELTDVSALETLAAQFSENRRRIRSVHR